MLNFQNFCQFLFNYTRRCYRLYNIALLYTAQYCCTLQRWKTQSGFNHLFNGLLNIVFISMSCCSPSKLSVYHFALLMDSLSSTQIRSKFCTFIYALLFYLYLVIIFCFYNLMLYCIFLFNFQHLLKISDWQADSAKIT